MALPNEITDIVEFPAIIKSGVIQILSPDLLKLEVADLQRMADVMGGELVYRKLRATYTELETPLCDHKNCHRPVRGALYCEDHPNGKIKSSQNRNLTMVQPRVS